VACGQGAQTFSARDSPAHSMSNFDILAILQILALIGMVYGYRKNRRDLMLLSQPCRR
jgi:hypothetical protein